MLGGLKSIIGCELQAAELRRYFYWWPQEMLPNHHVLNIFTITFGSIESWRLFSAMVLFRSSAGLQATARSPGEKQWTRLQHSSPDIFACEMEKLYWDAVGREMINIVRTLRSWYRAEDDCKSILEGNNRQLFDDRTVSRFVAHVSRVGQRISQLEGTYSIRS
jgi:hypothetical protein